MANDHAPHRILVADDQADVLEALRLLLKAEGYQIETVKSPSAVMKAIEARDFDLAIIDSIIRATRRPGRKAWTCSPNCRPLTPHCRSS